MATETLLSTNQLPIIDLSSINFRSVENKDKSKLLALELRKAIAERGIALLINHGISLNKVQDAWNVFDKFMQLPSEVKNKYIRFPTNYAGFVEPGKEILDKKRRAEIRYAYDISVFSTECMPSEIPEFRDTIKELAQEFESLTNLLLESIALALDMPINFFTDKHKQILGPNRENGSIFRLIYYPPIDEDINDLENYIRCGAHKDYGTFTLLSQDSEGGLEIKLPGNEKWQRVGYLPGSILINCGELLSLWTSDRYPAVNHRVVIPKENHVKNRGRHSMAFFVHPDAETMISPRDIPYPGGESKISNDEVCNAFEHLQKRFRETYF